ncbi:type II toxin-antitoxin system death-on-curing family toxin [Granulicella sp. dw_53]|uniref:type II toxin-antitoxin system death-on-curing family toxin n=1 Tax=Granulicella sp. dw_53 TaxID=2719792 RepID=UPI001BD1E9D8|nr:type II toxin-antitoxin system death-on-curing family toxin [Granulicella sp. dw_53]
MKRPKKPRWVGLEEAAVLHQMLLAEHGGASGIRDSGLFESAMDRPRNLHAYADPPATLFQLAAAYAFGLARNHPFVDGNKRIAFVVSLTFLRLNGFTVTATQEALYLTFYALAAGEISEAGLALWLQQHASPLNDR